MVFADFCIIDDLLDEKNGRSMTKCTTSGGTVETAVVTLSY